MITITNNVKKLKENKKAIIDGNTIINEQIESLINDLSRKIKKIDSSHNAIVVVIGDVKNFSFNIESEDENTIKLIQDVLNTLK